MRQLLPCRVNRSAWRNETSAGKFIRTYCRGGNVPIGVADVTERSFIVIVVVVIVVRDVGNIGDTVDGDAIDVRHVDLAEISRTTVVPGVVRFSRP